jgi:hypothetical protein
MQAIWRASDGQVDADLYWLLLALGPPVGCVARRLDPLEEILVREGLPPLPAARSGKS